MADFDRTDGLQPVDNVIKPQVLSETLGDNPQSTPHVPAPLGRGVVGKKANVAVVIVAGGSGERFGRHGGKQLLPVCGKPLLTWSIQAFDAVPQVGMIVVVCPEARIEEYRELAVDPYGIVTPLQFVASGGVRQESALLGAQAVPEEFKFIAMHDGARPLIQPDTIVHAINVLKGTLDADGVVCGYKAIDTLKVVENDNIVVGTPDRNMFWVAQTPQIFHRDVLIEAHHTALQEGFVGTDDSSIVERIGGHVVLVDCPRDNIKLTVPDDLTLVTAFLRHRYGSGETL